MVAHLYILLNIIKILKTKLFLYKLTIICI